MSPPCIKIRTILQYHNVQYKKIGGKKKDSEYKKIPVLLLNGIQINDSFIMVKNLAPILDGKALTEEEVKFEEEMSYGLMAALDSQIMGDGSQISNLIGKAKKPALTCCLGVCCCNCLCCRGYMSRNVLKKNGLENNSTDKFINMINERLDKSGFLQGDEIGILDLSLYGVTYMFAAKPVVASFQAMLDKSPKFAQWWLKMNQTVGEIDIN